MALKTVDSPWQANTLYYGDNIDILKRHFPDDSIDLIYLDPPFNSPFAEGPRITKAENGITRTLESFEVHRSNLLFR